jgi:hypothetical protein
MPLSRRRQNSSAIAEMAGPNLQPEGIGNGLEAESSVYHGADATRFQPLDKVGLMATVSDDQALEPDLARDQRRRRHHSCNAIEYADQDQPSCSSRRAASSPITR